MEDLNKLNCERPSIILRVTEHVPQIITFIQKLINAEQAYKTKSGSVYFRTQKFSVKSFFDLQDSTTTEGVGKLTINELKLTFRLIDIDN